MSITIRIISILFSLVVISCNEKKVIVFQSDFGLKDGAVSAMKGVAIEVDPDLKLFDLTHEIPSYNIWEAAYRLTRPQYFGRRVPSLFPSSIRVSEQNGSRLFSKLNRAISL